MTIDVAITIRRGDFVRDIAIASDAPVTALVGPSGGGKTSALLAIAGLVRPLAGHVRIGGRTLFDAAAGIDVPAHRRDLGVMFQEARLFPHLSVRANLGYARRADPAAVAAMAERLGIAALLDRWPRHLSGGETRRVALGRALLARPAALLLDEPLAHLDADRAKALLLLIGEAALDLPLLYVTHDPDEAITLGAQVVTVE
ncbi:ATP-binding cassette domain-containing protein [Sandarakinorhabdus sp. DWP1-3-1]|uniref:ATP-binding cassette domain-containing protein n=1 Tax=Sandarakinorhabdus sp. DWP1-3-1 TaxID=2804627 RepID=UPI003CEB49AC